MPRRLLGALVALSLAPAVASAVTPSLAVRSVVAGCQPKGAFAVPVTGAPAFTAGPHTYVVATGTATPCATLPVTTTATKGGVRLRWTAAPGETDYRVYRDGATVATAIPCCTYTDTSPTTTTGAPPPVAIDSARAGSSPDLTLSEDFSYDTPSATLDTDVVRLPAGLFLTAPVTGEALAVIDGDTVPGDIAATDDLARLTLTLRPDAADPIVVPMTLQRRDDGALDITTAFGSLRVDRLMRTFDGVAVTFPTSCAAKSVLLDADGAHASAPLQATDCDALAFAPTIAFSLAATGQTAAGAHPQLSTVVTQPAGQAAARAVTITLPDGITTTGGATATGTSAFAAGPTSLPVSGGATPTGRSVLSLDGLPETPFTDLRFASVLTNARDLCNGLGPADVTYVGHNGATVTTKAPIAVTGATTPCPTPSPTPTPTETPVQRPASPGVAVSARVGRSGRARLALTVRAGNAVAGSTLRRCRVQLPRGLRFTRAARRRLALTVDARRSDRLSVHTRYLIALSPAATRIVSVTARRGALVAGRRARRRLSFRVAVITQSGRTYRIVKRVTPRS